METLFKILIIIGSCLTGAMILIAVVLRAVKKDFNKQDEKYVLYNTYLKQYHGKIQLRDKSWRNNCWTSIKKDAYKYNKEEATDLATIWNNTKIIKI